MKPIQLYNRRKFTKKKQICNFFISKMIRIQESTNQILDVIASIIQITGTRNFFAIYNLFGTYIGNVGKSRKDSFSVYITETSFYIMLYKKFFVDPGISFT